MTNPLDVLEEGRRFLSPILNRHGFEWAPSHSGSGGSGGPSACGRYVRGDRSLEIHFRWSLGLVSYCLGEECIDHSSYMKAVLGAGGGNEYPGFSDDPLDGFRHLAHDLEKHCSAFLGESREQFAEMVHAAKILEIEGTKRRLP